MSLLIVFLKLGIIFLVSDCLMFIRRTFAISTHRLQDFKQQTGFHTSSSNRLKPTNTILATEDQNFFINDRERGSSLKLNLSEVKKFWLGITQTSLFYFSGSNGLLIHPIIFTKGTFIPSEKGGSSLFYLILWQVFENAVWREVTNASVFYCWFRRIFWTEEQTVFDFKSWVYNQFLPIVIHTFFHSR